MHLIAYVFWGLQRLTIETAYEAFAGAMFGGKKRPKSLVASARALLLVDDMTRDLGEALNELNITLVV